MKLRGFIFAASMVAASPAPAAYVIDINEVGADVVMTGNGSFNLTALSFFAAGNGVSAIAQPQFGVLTIGQMGNIDAYRSIIGPTSFWNGNFVATGASTSTGPLVGLDASSGVLVVQRNYVSGSFFTSSAAYNGKSLASLGLASGVYTWNWGQGAAADSLVLRIGQAAAVPEPATWAMMLLGMAGVGFSMRRKGKQTLRVRYT